MPITPLTKTTRFIPQGTSKYLWAPTLANYTAVLLTEIDTTTDLTGEVAAISGFSTTGNQVDVPDAQSRFTKRVPGSVTPDDSSITFYGSKDGDDAGTFFTRDQSGFLIFMDGGNVAAQPMEVFPVTVVSVSRQREITSASQVVVSFSITDEPSTQDIPAT